LFADVGVLNAVGVIITTPDSMAGSFMHVQMCVYGLSCCLFGHDIDTACYYVAIAMLMLMLDVAMLHVAMMVVDGHWR
jgi:hypothetical protein